jgi:hypothetical protein
MVVFFILMLLTGIPEFIPYDVGSGDGTFSSWLIVGLVEMIVLYISFTFSLLLSIGNVIRYRRTKSRDLVLSLVVLAVNLACLRYVLMH